MKNIKYVIIPDVHGRDFWKEAVEKYKDFDCKIIFLGDYMDPYPYEKIKDEDNYAGAAEIMKLKSENPDKFILLCGNHDLHYIDPELRASRYDWNNGIRNKSLIRDNLDNMRIAYACTVNGKNFLFTHAGLNAQWCLRHNDLFGFEFNDGFMQEQPFEKYEALNDFIFMKNEDKDHKRFFNALTECSFWRGGAEEFGSVVWADYREFIHDNANLKNIVQVFGHTQQEENPVNIENKIYCLDCRKYFLMDEDGDIFFSDGSPIESISANELLKTFDFYPSSIARNKSRNK